MAWYTVDTGVANGDFQDLAQRVVGIALGLVDFLLRRRVFLIIYKFLVSRTSCLAYCS